MLKALTALALLPTALIGETIPIDAPVTSAVLYANGATLTRAVSFTAPAGHHDLLITGLPASLDPASVRVAIDGASLGSVIVRQNRVLPSDLTDSSELITAKNEVDRLEAEVLRIQDSRNDILMRAQAANARLTYLATLSAGSDIAPSPETLQATLDLISAQTLAAHQEAAAAQREARMFAKALEKLKEALEKAHQTVIALTPSHGNGAMLSVAVSTEHPTSGTLTLTHLVHQAGWQPVYDLHLTHGDSSELTVRRGALVGQNTGEDWSDVALTLSTSRPNDQTRPSNLNPDLRWITDRNDHGRRSEKAGADYVMAEPAPAPIIEEIASLGFADGITATYAYPTDVSITSQADFLRLSLDTLSTPPQVFALANPLRDETAYLMASIINDTGELLLPSHEASFYLNGQFISRGALPLIAAGDEIDLSFGPINGLRLSHTLRDRESGDTGVLTSRNEQRETHEFSIRNLTDRSWDMRILGHVPYSEQEDLEVTWQSNPHPDVTNYKDRRGILAWHHTLGADETLDITLSHHLKWPKDMVLR
ncbi:DUF4139 domain-containing protein [Shimia sp.]|uniref:DUF4139 domain-containing protein n=1 Tax=Shimia sp. TaxID=1954381 RepID=UPI003298E758